MLAEFLISTTGSLQSSSMISTASSTSLLTPPTKIVRLVPSSTWSKGDSGCENTPTFPGYLSTTNNNHDGPKGDASLQQTEQMIQTEVSPQASIVHSRPAEVAVYLVVRPD